MYEFGLLLRRRLEEQVVCEFSLDAEIRRLGSQPGDKAIAGSRMPSAYLVVTVAELHERNVLLAFKAPPSVRVDRPDHLDLDLDRNGTTTKAPLLTLDSNSQLILARDTPCAVCRTPNRRPR